MGVLGIHAQSWNARGDSSVIAGLALCCAGLWLLTGCSVDIGDGGGGGQEEGAGDGEGDGDGGGSEDSGDSGDGHDDGDEGPPTHDIDEGDRVASLTVQAPEEERFLLRATMPLPAGMYDGHSLAVPFTVANGTGTGFPTQVEVVSRYPDESDGADVVELIAWVERPLSSSPGDRLTYNVIYEQHAEGEFNGHDDVDAFLDTPGSLRLRTTDVLGNRYSADLLTKLRTGSTQVRVLRYGELAHQMATHEIMLADDEEADGAFPHMMGVHAFVTEWTNQPFFSIDLHIHNSFSGHDKSDARDDALQRMYFENLELRVPDGWVVLQAFDDPWNADAYEEDSWSVLPLVKALPGGKMHVLPRQSRFTRRLVVAREGDEERARSLLEERGLAFCVPGSDEDGDPLFSWWSAETPRYYPQNTRLANLDHVNMAEMREDMAEDFEAHQSVLAEGLNPGYPIINGDLGWAHPYGVRYGGMTGGDEIYLRDGMDLAWSGSQEGYRDSQIIARMYVDRCPIALINIDGTPTDVTDWLIEPEGQDSYLHMWFFLRPQLPSSDPFGFNDAPTNHQATVDAQSKAPDYQGELEAYSAVDMQHYIRYTRNQKTLAWLGNDALAKLELRIASEAFRLSYHEHNNSPYHHEQGSSLKAGLTYVSNYPGWGLGFGRGQSWGMDASISVYVMGDETLRARYYDWFQLIAVMLDEGQSDCSGVLMHVPQLNKADGQYRVMQSFETSIINNAIWGLRTSVFEGKDDTLNQRLRSVVEDSVFAQTSDLIWRHEYTGPVSWIAMGTYDMTNPPYCAIPADSDGYGTAADHMYVLQDMAWGYRLTGDEHYLNYALESSGAGNLSSALHGSGLSNLENRGDMLSIVQELAGDE